jgi:hypothetical protein
LVQSEEELETRLTNLPWCTDGFGNSFGDFQWCGMQKLILFSAQQMKMS